MSDNNLKAMADAIGISPRTIKKRSLNYQYGHNMDSCDHCFNRVTVKFRGWPEVWQCQAIGIYKDTAAIVKPGATCRAFEGKKVGIGDALRNIFFGE